MFILHFNYCLPPIEEFISCERVFSASAIEFCKSGLHMCVTEENSKHPTIRKVMSVSKDQIGDLHTSNWNLSNNQKYQALKVSLGGLLLMMDPQQYQPLLFS